MAKSNKLLLVSHRLEGILEGKTSLGFSVCISSVRAVSHHGRLYLKKSLGYKYFTRQPLQQSKTGDNMVDWDAESAILQELPGQVLS